MIPPRLSTSWLGRTSTPLSFINRSIASRSAGGFPEALIALPDTLRNVSPTISCTRIAVLATVYESDRLGHVHACQTIVSVRAISIRPKNT